jgi:hypothetical protein
MPVVVETPVMLAVVGIPESLGEVEGNLYINTFGVNRVHRTSCDRVISNGYTMRYTYLQVWGELNLTLSALPQILLGEENIRGKCCPWLGGGGNEGCAMLSNADISSLDLVEGGSPIDPVFVSSSVQCI